MVPTRQLGLDAGCVGWSNLLAVGNQDGDPPLPGMDGLRNLYRSRQPKLGAKAP